MIGIIATVMIAVSVVYSAFFGGIDGVSNAVISSGESAVSLLLSIIGAMATWGGVMRIAQNSGITNAVARVLKPLIKLLFRNIEEKSETFSAIAMNITANLFGLGNASTPLGIKAMKELEKSEQAGETATTNMIMLAVVNSCSVQLVPTTVAALRLANGSASPFEILPCVLIVSVASFIVSVLCVKLFAKRGVK